MSKAVCPICDKPVVANGPYAPFCSQRCKLVDLGRWLDGDYAVPGPPIGGDGGVTPADFGLEGDPDDRRPDGGDGNADR